MANTTIKITQLPNIGNNLAGNTLLPVVDTSGVAVTEKVSVGNVGNFILTEAGNTLPPAFVSQVAYSVANAAQPNITSVGNLINLTVNDVSTLHIGGGEDGYVLQTDGAGNLNWTAMSGSGNGNPGGANQQIQYNDGGLFGGSTGFTFDADSNIMHTPGSIMVGSGGNTGVIAWSANTIGITSDSVNDYTGIYLVKDGDAQMYANGSVQIYANTHDAAYEWQFGTDGNLTLPTNTSSINYANGQPYSGVNTGNIGFTGNAIYSLGGVIVENADLTHGATAALLIPNNANTTQPVQLTNGYGNVIVTAGINTDTVNWTFDGTGNLTFPDNSGSSWPVNTQRFGMGNIGAWLDGQWTIGEFSGNGVSGEFGIRIDPSIEGPVGMTFPNNASSNTQPVQIYSTNGSGIELYVGSGSWEFDSTGNLILPDVANVSINYANGQPYGGSGGSVSIVPNDVTYGSGNLYGNANPGFTVVNTGDDDQSYDIPVDFPLQFLGNSYGSGSVWLVSNSYLTFGPDGAEFTAYHPVGPVRIPAPAIYVGAADLSNQKYYYGYADGTDIFVIGYEGSIETSGEPNYPAMSWELQVSASTPDQIKIVVAGAGNNGGSLNFPAGIWGISDGAEWVDQYQPLPWYSNANDSTYNSITIAPVTPVAASTIAFTGPGVTYGTDGSTTYVNIDPFDDAISVGYDDDNNDAIISSVYYGLKLTTARRGDNLTIAPLGDVYINASSASDNQPGRGYSTYIYGGDARDNPNNTGQNYDGGNVQIGGGNPVNGGIAGTVSINTNSKTWAFNGDGGTIFPQLNVQRGDNPSGTISGQTLLFGDRNQEAIISTPDGAAGTEYSQRLVINPGQGYNYGEGGDIYLWAGRGGSGSGSGGDIKIRGGQGGANTDGGTGGDGGYIRIEAGDSSSVGGIPGYIELTGGQGGPGHVGGYVNITGGYGATGGGNATVQGGYAYNGQGGNVNISGGASNDGPGSAGNINISSSGGTWTFDNTGNLNLPGAGVVYETNIPFGGLSGKTIALKPYGGTNADQQLLVYPTAGQDFNHLHLTSGNLLNTELFLGNDDFYVKLANTGNIVINTNDSVGNTAQWIFGTNGTILTPGDFIVETPSGIPATVTAITGSSGSWESNPSTDLATTGGTGTGLTVTVTQTGGYASTITIVTPGSGYSNGDAISVVSGSSSASFTISVVNNQWTLDTAGKLTLPPQNVSGPAGESQILTGSRRIINGVYTGATNPYAVVLPGDGSATVVYSTEADVYINSAKVTFAVQGTGVGANWEQFDVVFTPDYVNAGEILWTVSNRIKANSNVEDTIVTVAYGSGSQIQISLQLPAGQNGWASFDAVEFGLMVD